MIDKKTWERRYEHIKNFEDLLTDSGVIILKFMLHISKEEQKARLLSREQDDEKAWKLAVADWEERRHWDEYKKAYEDAISATSTKNAPWYIVPSDYKWYRSMIIARIIAETLRPYKAAWKAELRDLGERRKAELNAMREKNGINIDDKAGAGKNAKSKSKK
jgi:polyphosphate kinase 2 (PPK2 family)